MAVCVPKHVVCGWYDPSVDPSPPFVPSNTPCTMPSFDVTRARLNIGGTFFRSIYSGPNGNNVSIECVWQVSDGMGGYVDYVDGTNTLIDVARVVLNVTDGTTIEQYIAIQYGTMSIPPPPATFSWTVSAIPSLRAQLSASILITMPTVDTPTAWVSANDGEFLNSFPPTNLAGAIGVPASPNGIRTGPAQTLINISSTETPNGEINDKNNDGTSAPPPNVSIFYWNSVAFVAFSGTDCEDPNNPPPDCALGP